jgi:catechol 2,3-dioxygenase-like lactoylglutathione lyase family enzyme
MTAFKHTALVCGSEDNADRFYRGLLGLEKAEPKTLPRNLSRAIFDVDADLTVINYTGADLHFEIFLAENYPDRTKKIEHTCIEVSARQEFLDACRKHGVTVNQVEKGARTLLFVQDFDGNLFEVKTLSDEID